MKRTQSRLLTTAMPKSPIWKVPERLQKMLSGLMSMTMTPWLCRKSRPCACKLHHTPGLCKLLCSMVLTDHSTSAGSQLKGALTCATSHSTCQTSASGSMSPSSCTCNDSSDIW